MRVKTKRRFLMKFIRSLIVSAVVAGAFLPVSGFSDSVKQQNTSQKPAVEQAATPSTAMVNINTADADTLANRLNGIGIKKAQAIVSFREQNGPFKSVDDLANVKGIGAATLEKNRGLVSLN